MFGQLRFEAVLFERAKESDSRLCYTINSQYIGLFQKYHNTLRCSPQILHQLFFFQFVLGDIKSQEKLIKMLMQNFGGTAKSIMVFLKKAYSHN